MMTDLPEEIKRELRQSFQVEAAEHLQTMNQSLLKIERETSEMRRKRLIQEAFRATHSLKGAARSVELHDIEQIAHAIENVFQQARNARLVLEPDVCDVLYQMLDVIQARLEGQQSDFAPLIAQLEEVTHPEAEDVVAAPTENATPELPEAPESPEAPVVGDETIRVAATKLDSLMAQAGELSVSKISTEQRLAELNAIRQQLGQWPRQWREIRSTLDHAGNGAGRRLQTLLTEHNDYLQMVIRAHDTLEQALRSDVLRLGMMTADLQEDIRRVRMLPVRTIVLGLERTVRDAARAEAKQINFQIEGSGVELDKKILEALKDPLHHLLRNAVSHGIESPADRKAAGKPAKGAVCLTVRPRGSEISLTVSDDGRGFDLEALRQAGRDTSQGQGEALNLEDDLSLAFLPGVTTAREVTPISGRGIGLDVVRQRVEALHGRIMVDNAPGQGVTIEIVVPASLAMTRVLVVSAGAGRFALPLLSIDRIVQVEDVFAVSGKIMIKVDDASIPVVSLADVLGLSNPLADEKKLKLAVVIGATDQRLALWVDDIMTELELAVKPIGDPLRRVPNVIGAALMGTGEPVVVLNPADLIRSARGVPITKLSMKKQDDGAQEPEAHILVVDDSITTRTLEKNILETAGYHVTTAVDGVEALARLKEHAIDLVVTDIQMPDMDGIALTQQIRDTPEHARLPVILVTSLESREDRERGMVAGADAYVIKRGFDQANLLNLIKQFLDGGPT